MEIIDLLESNIMTTGELRLNAFQTDLLLKWLRSCERALIQYESSIRELEALIVDLKKRDIL